MGGRPVPLAAFVSGYSVTVPASMSSSTTLFTVDRDSPISVSSRRLCAPRSRNARTTRARFATRWDDVESGGDIALFRS
ncbi:hypothetical protein Acor_68810 [Acrocarpospora corrugata]|uniref:Uncharacterized protein n=1 Tax=Acrocarpospora corrugata TaxID=35763 RepID=A0A5M3WCI8_9ACTN|nr:hypothetical protein Acor_68810 [Acrocarpospora corrugata]